MSGRLRVGMVGAGMVSEYHIAGWLACPKAALVAIADPDLEKVDARGRLVPGARMFASLSEMLRGCDLDAVDIVTQPSTHGSLIAEAQAAGLHVMCQKPLAPDLVQAEKIAVALCPDTRVMVHENWRWRPQYRALRQALDTHRVPRPERFELRLESSGLLPDPQGCYPALQRQPFFADMPRFLVYEVLVHHLDTLSFLFGDVEIEAAELARHCRAIVGEDRADILLTAGGIPGRLLANFCVNDAPPLPSDSLFFNGTSEPIIEGWSLRISERENDSWGLNGYQQSYTSTIQHFVECLETGAQFETSVGQTTEILKLVEKVYQLADW